MSKGMRMLRGVTIFILDNWWILCIGMLLTALAVSKEYDVRGEFAVGGEWLITPLLLMLKKMCLIMQDEMIWRCKR